MRPQQIVHLPHQPWKNPAKHSYPRPFPAKTYSMGTIIMQRRWGWMGHVIKLESQATSPSRTALYWTLENLASNCRRVTKDPSSHLVGERSEAGSEQTRVGYL